MGTATNETKAKTVRTLDRVLQRQSVQDKVKTTGEKPSLVLFLFLGMIAMLKDVLDLLFNFLNVVPGLGLALSLVFGGCIALIIFLLLLMFDRSSGTGSMAVARTIVQRAIVFAGGTFIGMVPVVGIMPEMTLAVVILYLLAYRDWHKRLKQTSGRAQGSASGRVRQLAFGG